MRILLLSQWFQPEKFLCGMPFVRELIALGHEVEVLTGFPNYPQGVLYEGYHIKPLQKEILEGVPVIRVPLFPSHDQSAIRRIANYMSFAFSASTIGIFAVKRADVAYVYHPPGTVGLPACMLRLIRRIPFIYDIKDLWPDTLEASGMFTNRLGLWFVNKWCRFVYKRASKIVVCTPGFKKKLCERGVPEEKIEVIYNWCDDTMIRPVERDENLSKELGLAGRFNVIFGGNIGAAQALIAVLEAAKIIEDRYPKIQFVLIGDGIEKNLLRQKADDMKLKNVKFIPFKPISEIASILSLGDLLFVHLKDEPLFRITIPAKLQAYMAVGKPILNAVRGEAAELLSRANAGLSCEPENPKSIAETVIKFYSLSPVELKRMGDNGKKFYHEQLSLQIGAAKFEKIFRMVAGKSQQAK